ncbi:MAG: restriction endonuclease subunit S [Nostocales cyanobacterium LacPavin_0920_SED1_MAG_38_18]|nr:restriction endonuclease subunit S [Nostocales cyanobacterium LacPavin_0920_SED1_MAG_38_18]
MVKKHRNHGLDGLKDYTEGIEGYKKTEVGVIPHDWEVDSITKYCQEIFLGLTAKVDYVNHGGIPLIRATDISNGKLSFQNALFISNKQHKQLTKYRKAKLGDVLVSKSGSLGVCALVDTEKEFSIYESIIVLQPILNKLFSRFLLYLVSFQDTQKRLLGETVGSTVGHLNLNNFKQLQIPLPPLPEQKAIAQSLSDVNTLITALDQVITKKRNIKQGTMQQLLTAKKRLPGFSDEWKVKKLEDISTEIGDGIHATPEYVESSEFYFINGNNLVHNSIEINEKTKCVAQEEYRKYQKNLNDTTILMSINGTIGNIAFYQNENVILGKSAAYINIKNFISKTYIFYVLQTQAINCYFEDELTGSTIRNLSLKSIRNAPISVPPNIEEQKAIAQILSDMDAEIEALEQKRDKHKAIKQGMMQELLTGKTRLISSS